MVTQSTIFSIIIFDYQVSPFTRKPQWVVHGWPEHYPNVICEVQWGVIQLGDCQS
jgi:hypothetical protein